MAEPWYQDGLAFECTRCGNCCRGEPGYVWVTDEEIRKIAEFRGEPVTQTRDLHTKIVGHRRSLRERSNGDCDFWDKEAGCTIYPVRPPQCRTWPFWVSNLETPDDWERTKRTCPGAGKGELISSEEITRRLKVIRI